MLITIQNCNSKYSTPNLSLWTNLWQPSGLGQATRPYMSCLLQHCLFPINPFNTLRSKIFVLSRHSLTSMSLEDAKATLLGSRCHDHADFTSGSVLITLFKWFLAITHSWWLWSETVWRYLGNGEITTSISDIGKDWSRTLGLVLPIW